MRSKKIQSTYLNNCSLACTHAHIQIHTFWQSGAEQHAHQSSPCLSSRAPLQGADVWGQLTASANFCVQSKQQHSALLAAMGNVLLKWGEGWPLSHCKVSWGWVERGKKSEKEGTRRGETVSRLQVACIGKSPQFPETCCCVSKQCRAASWLVYLVPLCDIIRKIKLHIWLCLHDLSSAALSAH